MPSEPIGEPRRTNPTRMLGAIPNDTATVLRMVVGGAAVAALLVWGITFAAGRGFLPAQVVTGTDASLQAPATTDAATTAPGSQPVYESSCNLVATPPGAQCALALGDDRGHLVEQGLVVGVPKAWLARFAHASTPNDMAVIAALVRSPYAPLDGPGLQSLSISVDPGYAARLATVGVTPKQFLLWLYQNVPETRRPPWVR